MVVAGLVAADLVAGSVDLGDDEEAPGHCIATTEAPAIVRTVEVACKQRQVLMRGCEAEPVGGIAVEVACGEAKVEGGIAVEVACGDVVVAGTAFSPPAAAASAADGVAAAAAATSLSRVMVVVVVVMMTVVVVVVIDREQLEVVLAGFARVVAVCSRCRH